jgi:hypothetical protein
LQLLECLLLRPAPFYFLFSGCNRRSTAASERWAPDSECCSDKKGTCVFRFSSHANLSTGRKRYVRMGRVGWACGRAPP